MVYQLLYHKGGEYEITIRTLITPIRSLSDQAYEKIRESIISLELLPGQTVQENELADLLGISRTPIRDAFHLLIAEQLIEVLPQRTKKIAGISVSKVLERSMIRLSLESTAFRIAARQWGTLPEHTKIEKSLTHLLEEQQEAAEAQDTAQFLALDEQFHKQILLLAGNQTLIDVVNQMRGHLNRYRFLAMKELVLTKGLVKEHEDLLHQLKARDEQAVAEILERHLGKIKNEIDPLREKFAHFFQD